MAAVWFQIYVCSSCSAGVDPSFNSTFSFFLATATDLGCSCWCKLSKGMILSRILYTMKYSCSVPNHLSCIPTNWEVLQTFAREWAITTAKHRYDSRFLFSRSLGGIHKNGSSITSHADQTSCHKAHQEETQRWEFVPWNNCILTCDFEDDEAVAKARIN